MKQLLSICLCLLLLAGCSSDGGGQNRADGTASPSDSAGATAAVSGEPAATLPPLVFETAAPTEPAARQAAEGKLTIAEMGSYSGVYPEGGEDRQVENVAALLVVNTSHQVCQYCTLEYDIDGAAALFSISELPAGKAVWVLESTAMTIEKDAVYSLKSDTAVFREGDSTWLSGIAAEGDGGTLTVTNTGQADQPRISVYYKLTYGDNTYLGGIAYRVQISDLKAGESKTVTAGHFYAGACEIVGIYADGV